MTNHKCMGATEGKASKKTAEPCGKHCDKLEMALSKSNRSNDCILQSI
jgi:hypothetical protein